MLAEKNPVRNILREGGDLFLVLAVMGIVLLMVLPIPPFFMDIFLVFSISLSILIFLVALYAYKPLDFSVFPTLILFATLLRLTLNIASTRLILLNGSSGEGAAGRVIEAFGYFVAGGNMVVGMVVFIILVVINFVVITKGAGRIAEVAARFTLDAMPGKQLAIDADLNAGSIDDKEAKRRREELEKQTDFYGAMDGASKFVRGDAVATIVITLVNIIGGFVIGMAQQGLNLSDAARIYTILSIGDGLVGQIPALIISTAAGIIVTKVASQTRLSQQIGEQTLSQWRPMGMAGMLLGGLGLIPSLPHLPFLLMASLLGFAAFKIWKQSDIQAKKEALGTEGLSGDQEALPQPVDAIPPLDMMELEVGYDLVPIVDQRVGGEFPQRIVGIRRQLASEMGVLLSPVHIRDNLKLRPGEYRIFLKGAVIGQGELMIGHVLALDPGMITRPVEGIPTKDPTFGLNALWIPEKQKEAAVVAGYTVVDLSSVIATHLVELVRHNLHELFGWQDLAKLIEQVKTTHPRLIADLFPELLSFGVVLKVVQNLLREQVSIRDITTILEALAEYAPMTKDPLELTEQVRMALGRTISQRHVANDQSLYAITLSRAIEEKIIQSVAQSRSGPQLALEPNLAKNIVTQISQEAKKNLANNQPAVVLTSQQVRPHLYRLIEKFIPNLAVLAHAEVAGHAKVKPVGMIGEAA
ncbi:MAG: flagellar biosynthesis protein FlhA [Deltaproteobacteria bacterium]|nr:flagellar biosynthesis protein FlhA [Deltaproteobacteria bacterium]